MPRATQKTFSEQLHLVRLDGDRLAGWQMRLPLWHPLSGDKPYTEMYSDSRYGGKAQALAVARVRRDELFARAKLPLELGGHTTNSRSTTGMVGVTLRFDARRTGKGAFSWTAQWKEDGCHRRTNFSVSIHGFERALKLAMQAREQGAGFRFTDEQRTAALALRDVVDTYVRTGEYIGGAPLERPLLPKVAVEPEGSAKLSSTKPTRAPAGRRKTQSAAGADTAQSSSRARASAAAARRPAR